MIFFLPHRIFGLIPFCCGDVGSACTHKQTQKTKRMTCVIRSALWSCGEGGIRTPGASQLNGFQDRRNRPLCHLSKGQKWRKFFKSPNNY